VVAWIILFGLFLAFIPFNRQSQKRPASVYIAFVVALALEMFGIPLSMYVVSWAFGVTLPVGTLWGHTLQQYIGYWGMYIGFALNLVGAYLVVQGWRNVHEYYWRNDEGTGTLVTTGIYAYIRHPQYAGFILITLGLLVHWATIPLLVMWPILVLQYYRLAKREERKLEREFGDEYTKYHEKVPMFIPSLNLGLSKSQIVKSNESS
jgi:protein-S-isoprenylcysteine O-methyltransferase Ste14